MSIDNNIQLSFYEDEEEEVGLYSKRDSENNRETLKKEIRFLFKNEEDYNADDIVDSYMGFYPLNCDINVKITLGNHIKANQNIKKDNYYQEIFSDYYNYKIEITKIDNSEETCYFYISSFSKDNNNNYGITLLNNTLQEIIFHEDRNLIPFSFPHTNLENDININFEPLNKAEYTVKVKINDEIIEKKTINSKANITLKADAIKKNCENFKYICNILLNVEKNQKEANFKITLTSVKDYGKVIDDDEDNDSHTDSDNASDNGSDNGNNKKDDEDDDDDDDDKLIIILSIFGAVLITIIIGVIIYITQVYNSTTTSQTLSLTTGPQTYIFKATDVGNCTITITCEGTSIALPFTITESQYIIEPVSEGLVFDFNPFGYSNNSEGDASATERYASLLSSS